MRAMLSQMGPSVQVNLFDPCLVRDFMVKHTEQVEKAPVMQHMFSDLLGESFLFAKGDETWKMKRKACTPGFYKEKLTKLIHAMKQSTAEMSKEWLKCIEMTKEKQITINMTEEMVRIYTKTIL